MAAKTSSSQRRTVGRVMHEAKHGELKSGPGGKGGPVKSRKQAIAIALHEAGESKYDSPSAQKRSAARSRAMEARGRTGQQEKEGKSRVGARGKQESSPAMRRQPASRSARTTATRSRAGSTRKPARNGHSDTMH
jgi:hypothetical protein